jgi:HSP20 family protein
MIMLPLRRNQNWLPDIFNDMFDNDWITKSNVTAVPAVNVIEKEHEYDVEIAAPGMTKDDFKVSLDADNNLDIALEKKEDKKEENKGDKEKGYYLRREFSFSQFHQTLMLPDDVDREKIDAHVENGVLNVTLPKMSEQAMKKENKIIEIK